MLFKDSNKLKEYTEFTEINFASVKLTIRQVEESILVPLLSYDQYKLLDDAYTAAGNEGILSAAHQKLLDKCRMVVGPYVTFFYAPKSEVQLSDSGPRRAETANVKTAYGYQVVNFREQKLREGEAAAESLLQFLEKNKADYPAWVASDEFKEYRSLFVKTAAEFDKAFKTASPYRNYWAWRYKMVDIEEHNIKPAIQATLFNTLKEKGKVAEPAFTDKEKELLSLLRKTIAYFTVAFAVPFHVVRLDSAGITIASQNSTVSNKDQELRAPAMSPEISHIIRSAESSGRTWLETAMKFISDNASDFPSWTSPSSDTPITSGNESFNSIFGMA